MSNVLLAKERSNLRQSTVRELRETGQIPCVIYGTNQENKAIYVDERQFFKVMREVGKNGVITIQLNNEQFNVMMHEYQTDPIKKNITHVDFLSVDMSQEVEANVRVQLVGDAEGVKLGGVIQQPLFEVSITSTPSKIPQVIEVDVSNLQIGESITIGDLKAQHPYEFNHNDDELVASILAPQQNEVDAGEDGEERGENGATQPTEE